MAQDSSVLNEILQKDEAGTLQRWIDAQLSSPGFRSERISRGELSDQSRRFLSLLRQGALSGTTDIQSPAWANVRQMLEDLSTSRAHQGFSPVDTAMFIFSLKDALFEGLRESGRDPATIAAA